MLIWHNFPVLSLVASEYPSTGENLVAAAKPVQVPLSGPVHPTQPQTQSPPQAPVHDTAAPSHSNLAQERTGESLFLQVSCLLLFMFNCVTSSVEFSCFGSFISRFCHKT